MSFALPPEDHAPGSYSNLDVLLRRQLELSTRKHFFEACDGSTQSLLMECDWDMSVAEALLLVIHCPDVLTNWRMLNRMTQMAETLSQFSPMAKIRICPPTGEGDPFDMRVDERSEYRDGPQSP